MLASRNGILRFPFSILHLDADAWATLAYPSNVAEIVSLGYSAWASNRANDQNRRLVGFTVVSSKGNWPIRLTVGGVPVLCDGKEELKSALDCGAKYAFSVSDGEVPEITLLTTNGVEHAYGFPLFGYPVEHTLGDMTVHWDAPGSGWVCRKADVVLSEPDARHFFQNDSCQISATVTNCMASAYLGCRWIGGEGISFSNPHSLSTAIVSCSGETGS